MNYSLTRLALSLAAGLCLFASPAWAQLRIVDYNAATDTNPSGDTARAGMATVMQAIGLENKNGIQRPLDVLSLQETTSTLGGAQSIVNVLNTIYGAGTYARSTVVGSSTDNTTTAVIYNTHTVQLIGQTAVGVASTSGAARAPMRFEFQPVGYDSSAAFYIYSDHYKAGTAASDKTRRDAEAQTVRADANALGANTRVIFSGDYNIQSSSEAMYQTLTAAGGPGRAIDPLNTPGSWTSNASFAGIHTQAPLVTGVNGLTGGGMDDRFDFQLMTAPLLSGNGMSYIGPSVPNLSGTPSQNSYHAFGNNGTTFNNNINAPSNTALPASEYNPGPGQPSRTDVLNALTTASDHLPVVADYQLPSRMSAVAGTAPAKAIQGSSPTVNVSVSNSAPVQVALGADQLTYNVAGTGAVTGTSSGTALALAAPNTHTLGLDTSTLGAHSGSIGVTGTSDSVSNGSFAQPVNFTVLQHSAGEFVDPSGLHTLTIDFGSVLEGTLAQANFQLANLAGSFRAAMDLQNFVELGDGSNRFSTDLTLFQNLLSGSSTSPFHMFFNTSTPGSFSATYLLTVGDEADVFGGTSGPLLQLNVIGTVNVPEPATVVMFGLASAGLVGWRLRTRRRRPRNAGRAAR